MNEGAKQANEDMRRRQTLAELRAIKNAHQKEEPKADSLQQLKAEILPMINSIREDLNRDALNSFYTNRACDNLDIVAAKLSAI